MIKKYFKQFIDCHKGTLNKTIHVIGFGLIGVGIVEKSLSFVLIGGVVQELGHFYQYFKTGNYKESPLYCLKPQSIFALPLFILIIFYVMLVK